MLSQTTLVYNFNFKYLSLTTNIERQKTNRQKMHAFTVFFLSMLNNRDCSFLLFFPFLFFSFLFSSFLFLSLLFSSFCQTLSNLGLNSFGVMGFFCIKIKPRGTHLTPIPFNHFMYIYLSHGWSGNLQNYKIDIAINWSFRLPYVKNEWDFMIFQHILIVLQVNKSFLLL